MTLRVLVVSAAILLLVSCAGRKEEPQQQPQPRRFATPEEAVQAFIATVKGGKLEELLTYLGPEGGPLVSSSDPATGRKNQQVFVAAAVEGWHLEDRNPTTKVLVIGNEDWPFPIPLVKGENGWSFDAAAGADEVLSRRIGRNELAVIDICHAYVKAQRAYARTGHDGKRAGIYALKFNSDAGRQNGLYWPPKPGAPASPLGDLVASASSDGIDLAARKEPAPFHGYYFRILTGQGEAAAGGAMDYLTKGELTRGFALVAWPSQYDATGVMTFIVGTDGVVFEKDLGPDTGTSVKVLTQYNPDNSWKRSDGK